MQHLGVIGLGTMGANLARNAARRGMQVAVYNRTSEKTDSFVQSYGAEGSFIPCHTIDQLLDALPTPRVILLMVNAGAAVDAVIRELVPQLSRGDILIDGGNSHYRDTERRERELAAGGLFFVGMGVSGGHEGALNGPSLMPGGNEEAVRSVLPLLEQLAATDHAGGKCVAYMGPGGAGHFVKMVHNGIEYGLMQLIAESDDLLRRRHKMDPPARAGTFGAWNAGMLRSFLMGITAKILAAKDDDGQGALIDVIGDAAAQKGTGKWTVEAALDLGVSIPSIVAAVEARILSGDLRGREAARAAFDVVANDDAGSPHPPETLRGALEAGFVLTYMQGFALLRAASAEWKWDMRAAEIARVWSGGCIIRSALLQEMESALSPGDASLFLSFKEALSDGLPALRQVVADTAASGVPAPAFSSCLWHIDTLRGDRLPQRLIQAQRDYFGAHGFERTDRPGVFHADWPQ